MDNYKGFIVCLESQKRHIERAFDDLAGLGVDRLQGMCNDLYMVDRLKATNSNLEAMPLVGVPDSSVSKMYWYAIASVGCAVHLIDQLESRYRTLSKEEKAKELEDIQYYLSTALGAIVDIIGLLEVA